MYKAVVVMAKEPEVTPLAQDVVHHQLLDQGRDRDGARVGHSVPPHLPPHPIGQPASLADPAASGQLQQVVLPHGGRPVPCPVRCADQPADGQHHTAERTADMSWYPCRRLEPPSWPAGAWCCGAGYVTQGLAEGVIRPMTYEQHACPTRE
uniref:Uncharacterized protein n=1 Tax=Triticum urartu TaxID=4572 RepID=A0A8R7TR81_TRIUA